MQPKPIILTEAEPKYAGVTYGGEIRLSCSKCGTPLVDIIITRPNEIEEFTYQATCCHCGDHSFQQKIKGGIAYEAPRDKTDRLITALDDVVYENNLVTFKTIQVQE